MLNRFARALFTRLLTPIAKLLLRLGVSPDAVTFVGTLGVSAGALIFYPQGELFWGTVFITCFVFSDTIDGTMARLSGRTGKWGAFLDSTLDRIADGAVFAGLVLYFANDDEMVLAAVSLACLVLGGVVSYAKARAEGLGMTADVGIAERADRLVAALVAAGLSGLGVPYLLEFVLWALAFFSLVTVIQRMAAVYPQAKALAQAATPPPASSPSA